MDGIVDQRSDGLALRTLRLDHVHAPVVEVGCVVVVGDLALGLAGSDLDPCGLEAVDGLVDRQSGLVANEVHVLEVAGVAPLAVGEGVAIRSAVGVGRADQDVRGGNPVDLGAYPVAQDRGEPQQIERHDGHGNIGLANDEGPGRQLAAFLARRLRHSHPARDRQQRIGCDDPPRRADLDLGVSSSGLQERTKA